MTAAQKAMAYAFAYPEVGKGGRGEEVRPAKVWRV